MQPVGTVPTFGDLAAGGLAAPVVGMAATPSGLGYWLVASDGGVFAFGDAVFVGSLGGVVLNESIVGMAATPSGLGYWLVAADGGVFAFGDAGYHGSAPAAALDGAFVALMPSRTGAGYALADSMGRVSSFGDAKIQSGARCDPSPVVDAVSVSPDGALLARRDLDVPSASPSASSAAMDSASIRLLLRHAQACQAPRGNVGPELVSPLLGLRVRSGFGLRLHPIWRVVQLHSGLDTVAAGRTLGAPVTAASNGTVVAVDRRIAYGVTVVVDHGDRTATVYAHLGSAEVSVGQIVAAGDLLGRAGSTGFSTGPHLHFEVRFDGEPIDPAPYLAPLRFAASEATVANGS